MTSEPRDPDAPSSAAGTATGRDDGAAGDASGGAADDTAGDAHRADTTPTAGVGPGPAVAAGAAPTPVPTGSPTGSGSGSGSDPGEGSGGGTKKTRKHLPLWQETILLLVLALGLAVLLKTFFVQAFYIPSGSMEPTLVPDDRILVQKVSYWGGEPERGDIVVFDDPGDWLVADQVAEPGNPLQRGLELIGLYPSGGHLVKRVVGVGGDTVAYCPGNSRIEVNGELIDEPYLAGPRNAAVPGDSQRGCTSVYVPEGRLWVMGDNRGNSQDSRAHTGVPGGGTISEDAVVGKAWVLVWPFDRAGRPTEATGFDQDELDSLQGTVEADQ